MSILLFTLFEDDVEIDRIVLFTHDLVGLQDRLLLAEGDFKLFLAVHLPHLSSVQVGIHPEVSEGDGCEVVGIGFTRKDVVQHGVIELVEPDLIRIVPEADRGTVFDCLVLSGHEVGSFLLVIKQIVD